MYKLCVRMVPGMGGAFFTLEIYKVKEKTTTVFCVTVLQGHLY